MKKEFCNSFIPFMLRQAQHERDTRQTVRPELVEGRTPVFLKISLKVCLLFLLPFSLLAVDVYQLPNPEQQQAYETLTQELRCLVCQNQNIADSNAELAGDLRRQVFEMLQQGKSKDEIVTFMTDRYGDFVMYNPPLKTKTALLWLGPVAFLLMGLVTVVLVIRKRKQIPAVPTISPEQQAKIKSLLSDEELG